RMMRRLQAVKDLTTAVLLVVVVPWWTNRSKGLVLLLAGLLVGPMTPAVAGGARGRCARLERREARRLDRAIVRCARREDHVAGKACESVARSRFADRLAHRNCRGSEVGAADSSDHEPLAASEPSLATRSLSTTQS